MTNQPNHLTPANPATDRQVAFLVRLFDEAQADCERLVAEGRPEAAEATVAAVTAHAEVIAAVKGGRPVDKFRCSAAIDALLTASRGRPAAGLPVGLAALGAERVIPNKYAKSCGCGERVDAQAGFAALVRGAWRTVCQACATEDPEARKAAREAAEAAEEALEREITALAIDLLTRAGVDGDGVPEVRIAIPSGGRNDLDFLRVRAPQGLPMRVFRVIGGRDDQPLAPEVARTLLEQVAVFTEDVPAAVARFGQELGHCGRCGRHLTDEVSRAIGLGPDCALKYRG